MSVVLARIPQHHVLISNIERVPTRAATVVAQTVIRRRNRIIPTSTVDLLDIGQNGVTEVQYIAVITVTDDRVSLATEFL